MGPRDQIKTVFSLLIKQKGATGCLWAGEPRGLTGILGRPRNRQVRGRGRRRPAGLFLSPTPDAAARPLLRSPRVRVRGLPRKEAPLPAPPARSAQSPTAAGRDQRVTQERRTVIARQRQAGARSALAPTTPARGDRGQASVVPGATDSPEGRP